MYYTIHSTSNCRRVKALLPEGAKIIQENFSMNWFIIESALEWDALREHYKGVAVVGIANQEV